MKGPGGLFGTLTAGGLYLSLAGCGSVSSPLPEFSLTEESQRDKPPIDQQLACADQAASQYGVERQGIQPVSSVRVPSGVFEVTLLVGIDRAICLIDQTGTILSITRTPGTLTETTTSAG